MGLHRHPLGRREPGRAGDGRAVLCDFLWRTIAAPADFKLARIGEWDRGLPIVVVSLLFCTVHFEWLTAIVWGFMIGGLLLYTRSLGACIIMHGVTNFLRGAYVLWTHDWKFW